MPAIKPQNAPVAVARFVRMARMKDAEERTVEEGP